VLNAVSRSENSYPWVHYVLLLLLLLNALSADAKTLTVGPDDSLQTAIFMARTGDVVLVSEGTYYEHVR